MKASSVRKHLAPALREEILHRYQKTALTQRAFAAQAGVSVSTLQSWLRKAAARQVVGQTQFIALPQVKGPLSAAPAYRLVWPSGVALEVRAGFAAAELAAWLQLLPAL
jgi:lambda repressor-like predicted transcriptional regulator